MSDINVYTGPMKCGKTQKILDEARRQQIAGKDIVFFKPKLDDRFGENYITSRNGNKIEAINIESIDEIQNYDAEVYFIDEFQFLNGEVDTLRKLAEKGKKFHIAGLNLTAERKTFGKMGDLMCMADNIQMLTAICEICKNDNAVFSYYKGGKSQEIVIGSSQYIPTCRKCYEELLKKNF
jgi:thymidine kinase